MTRKLLLDVDTGIDDALAITYALSQKAGDLIAVSTVFGNTELKTATKNTLDLLSLFGREDIPVYPGAAHPWEKAEWIVNEHLHRLHGYNGIGDVRLPSSSRNAEEESASDAMIRLCREYQKDLTLVCVGPLTNLADALKKDEEALHLCEKIVIMGGALTIRGNATPYSEANIHNDPEAAKYVLESDLPLVLIGLDVTLKTIITGSDIASWKEIDTDKSELLYGAAAYYYTGEFGDVIGGAMHDPLAYACALYPELIKDSLPICLTVDLEGESRGRTVTDRDLLNKEHKTTQYALDVDEKAFLDSFTSSIRDILR